MYENDTSRESRRLLSSSTLARGQPLPTLRGSEVKLVFGLTMFPPGTKQNLVLVNVWGNVYVLALRMPEQHSIIETALER